MSASNVVFETQQVKETGLARIEELCRYLLPGGKKVNNRWRAGSVNGDTGQSFDVNLTTGQFGDWADGGQMQSGAIDLWMAVKHVDFSLARSQLAQCLGIQLTDKKETATSHTRAAPRTESVFNWSSLLPLNATLQERLCVWRGFSPESVAWLVSQDLVRTIELVGVVHWAFPIVKDGHISGCHHRPVDPQNGEKADWGVLPSNKNGGPGMQPLVIGDLTTAIGCYTSESTWDTLAACDKLGVYRSQDWSDLAFFCTRGAANGGSVKQIPETARIYAWMQNDEPAEKWFTKVRQALKRPFYRVEIPTQFKDLNDWTRSGATAADLSNAVSRAKRVELDPGDQPDVRASAETNGDQPPPRFRAGHSLAWYANQALDPTQTLLGDRYLCRSGGMFVVAPSGMGKSTLSLQMAVLWCCGLVAFGIKPSGKLRILIVQSEDDQGDCTEMAQVMNHLELTDKEKALVEENTELIRCNDCVGHRFVEALKARLTVAKDEGKPFDLVIINPYGVFLGDDVKNTKATTRFLNELLNPVLSEFNIGAILIHHTPKTNFQNTENYRIWDWMYWGAGCASISNWARAILVIKPESEDMSLFKFVAAKRGKRIGEEWQNSFEKYFSWSTIPGVLRWELASDKQIASATATKGAKRADLDAALEQVPLVDSERKSTVLLKIREVCKVNEKLAAGALNQLIDSGKVQEINIKNQNKGRGYAGVVRSSEDNE